VRIVVCWRQDHDLGDWWRWEHTLTLSLSAVLDQPRAWLAMGWIEVAG
jgi:hypothetical protein